MSERLIELGERVFDRRICKDLDGVPICSKCWLTVWVTQDTLHQLNAAQGLWSSHGNHMKHFRSMNNSVARTCKKRKKYTKRPKEAQPWQVMFPAWRFTTGFQLQEHWRIQKWRHLFLIVEAQPWAGPLGSVVIAWLNVVAFSILTIEQLPIEVVCTLLSMSWNSLRQTKFPHWNILKLFFFS